VEAVFQGLTAGDATGDHQVNMTDFGAIARNWGQSGKAWSDGDFNGDGVVDTVDFGIMARNWGWTLPPAIPTLSETPIPEPATLLLLALGGLVLVRRRLATT
jgi:hypothetical protein